MNKLEKIKKHEEMKQLSIYSYDVNKRQIAEGYNLLGVSPMDNGFYACVVRKGNDITIVYQGTDFTKPQDYDDDLAMAAGKWPKQADNALDLYDHIKDEYPGCDVSVAGHSLGGSLAQIVGVLRNTTAVTFNAYGTKQIIKNRYGSIDAVNMGLQMGLLKKSDLAEAIREEIYGDNIKQKAQILYYPERERLKLMHV